MLIHSKLYASIFALILNYLSAQYTDDCYNNNNNNPDGDWGCYVLPDGCINSNCEFIVKWKNESAYVDFQLITYINYTARSPNQAFSALGFSLDRQMGNDSVCMCRTKNALPSVETYFNDYKQNTDVLNESDRSLGLFNISAKIIGSYLMCRFSRIKKIENLDKFYDISNPYYLLVASGKTNSLGAPVWDFDKTYVSLERVDLQVIKIILNDTSTTDFSDENATNKFVYKKSIPKIKAHACLNVFAWMLIASTGLIFTRYYKYLFHSKVICYSRFWLSAHRALMMVSLILSIIGFLVVLSGADWRWIPMEYSLVYAHAIFGILTISLAFSQSLIGFFYTSVPMSYSKRKIFHYTHRSVGTSTYVFAIVTLFLGVSIPQMMLGRIGWGIIVGWTLWSLVLPLVIEILTELIESLHKEKTFAIDENDPKREEIITDNLKSFRRKFNKIKSVLMVFHLFISISLSVSLVVVICLYDSVDFVDI